MIAWWTSIPFLLLLVAIAAAPLIPATRSWWDRPAHQLLVALVAGVPVALGLISTGHGSEVAQAVVEYAQFVCLLFGLFVVAGGIALRGSLVGSPRVNTVLLALGGVAASLIGTTGAAMMLIRPLLAANAGRRQRAHSVVFAIFIMANCGGLLTPLGDPPLFLGLLRGVPFAWTLNLWPHWLLVNGLLLLSFFCLDRALLAREPGSGFRGETASGKQKSYDITQEPSPGQHQPLAIIGKLQFLWFALIVTAVALVPSVDIHSARGWIAVVPWRELVILVATALSWLSSDRDARFRVNQFSFAPIQEVAALFSGIFLTMVPALMLLDHYAPRWHLGPVSLYFMTGGLSSVLDNAPTYATFFEVAQGMATGADQLVAGVPQAMLVAISTGAVFWGGMTYIGNGPNFMVRAVAEHRGVVMPSFPGYIAWSLRWLAPVLVSALLILIAQPAWARALGVLLALVVVIRALLIARAVPWIRLPRQREYGLPGDEDLRPSD